MLRCHCCGRAIIRASWVGPLGVPYGPECGARVNAEDLAKWGQAWLERMPDEQAEKRPRSRAKRDEMTGDLFSQVG